MRTSDYLIFILEQIKHGVASAEKLDWRLPLREELKEAFDCAVAADVTYFEELIPDMLQRTKELLRPDGILVSINGRWRYSSSVFRKCAADANLEIVNETVLGETVLIIVQKKLK